MSNFKNYASDALDSIKSLGFDSFKMMELDSVSLEAVEEDFNRLGRVMYVIENGQHFVKTYDLAFDKFSTLIEKNPIIVNLPYEFITISILDSGLLIIAEQDDDFIYASVMTRTKYGNKFLLMPFEIQFPKPCSEKIITSSCDINIDPAKKFAVIKKKSLMVKSLELQECKEIASVFARHVLDLLCCLSCSNVETQTIKPSNFSKQRKKNKNKQPLFESKVLVLKNSDKNFQRTNNKSNTNKSPRSHLRRGHIRRLQNGGCVWVKQTLVNGEGFINKEYDLTN